MKMDGDLSRPQDPHQPVRDLRPTPRRPWRRRLWTLAAAMGLALGAGATEAWAGAVGCSPEISLREETVDATGGSVLAQYVLRTGNLCGQAIVALAVDNDASLAAFANLSGWSALVVTDDFWDAGIVLSRDDFGCGCSYVITTGPAGAGSFASFFGPYAQKANIYWLSAHYGGPVVDNSTAFTSVGTPVPLPDDAFQFETRALASRAFVFTESGGTVNVSAVPEPAPAAVLAAGSFVLLAFARRHSRVPKRH